MSGPVAPDRGPPAADLRPAGAAYRPICETVVMATVRFFAAAAEAAGTQSEHVEADDLGSLLASLRERHGAELARVLALGSVLHDGQYVSDPDLPLGHDAVLDVLPPFAGG